MKSQMLKNRRTLLATSLLLLTTSWTALADREKEANGKKEDPVHRARTVSATPIGSPTWRPTDFQFFTAPIGTAASGYAEFGMTLASILPPPEHQFCADLGGPGPGAPHLPPYTREMSDGVEALHVRRGPHFRPADFSNGNGVYCTWMTVPSPGITGFSPDFVSGPIIPNTLFPIHVSGATYKDGELLNPFLGTFDVPPLTPALSCPFNVDGHSHFPIFYADNLDFMPAGTDPVGSWEYRITMTDSGGNGWAVSAQFFITGRKHHIIPAHAKYRGLSYGEWGAQWWKSMFSIPVVGGSHPYLSGGAFEGDEGVVFLAALPGGVTLDVEVPSGTPLFFPVMNAECSVLEPDPFHGDDEAELRACANGHIDNTSGLFAVIDGVSVKNLEAYRVESPLFKFGPLPEDNLLDFFGLDAPVGTTTPSVDAGVYLLLAPLSVGKHTIHVGGTFDLLGFAIDTTFNITVQPRR